MKNIILAAVLAITFTFANADCHMPTQAEADSYMISLADAKADALADCYIHRELDFGSVTEGYYSTVDPIYMY